MRVKRTYKLSVETVEAVKRLADDRSVASTQDGVVEVAIRELVRRLRDDEDAKRWEQAASDREFLAEAAQLSSEFASDDHRAWPT